MEPDQPVSFVSGLIALTQVQETLPEAESFLIGSAILLILLFLSAVFSGSEVALFSLSPTNREELETSGTASSKRVVALLRTPREVLVTILILNTLTNVSAAIITAILAHELATAFAWSETITILGEIVALTFILLVVSEITPKLIAARQPLAFARRISWPLTILHKLFGPGSVILARTMRAFHGRFEKSSGRLSGDELKVMADIGMAHGTLEEGETELIHSIVAFGDTTVREIMISRMDIIALSASSNIDVAISIIRETGHSRLPLYLEHLDNILGIIYAKDLLRHVARHRSEANPDWIHLARPAIFVPPGKKLDDLLRDFQKRKTHIALVVDEYGGTAGLITLEDVLEEIVGDIRDEHDFTENNLVEELSPGRFRVDAKIDLDELNETTGTELDTNTFEFETLGGLILNIAGQIPAQGDQFEHENLHMVVESLDNHRIGTVLLTLDASSTDKSPLDDDASSS